MSQGDGMRPARGQLPHWPLPAGLLLVLLLFSLPPALVAGIGWPSAAPPALNAIPVATFAPLAPPPPPEGLPTDLIYWLLLAAGLALGFAGGVWLLVWRAGPELLVRWRRLYLLSAVGLASFLTYILNFLLPFPLARYYNLPGASMGLIAGRDGGAALATTAAILALFLLYGLAYRLCRGQDDRRLWAVVLAGALLLALVNFLVVMTTSTDVYDHIARGRITGQFGGNPYVHTPDDYPFEGDFLRYVAWDDTTSAYGPLWETVNAFLARLAGNYLGPNVLAHKAVALAGYLVCVGLIAAIRRQTAPDRALAGVVLFAWNPLVLLDGAANAHNDLLMVALLLGAFWFLCPARSSVNDHRGWLTGVIALLLLTAAVLVKFVPALLYPIVFLYLLIPAASWRRRLAWGLLLLIPAILLVADYYGVFWQWPAVADTFTRRGEMFRMSIPSAAKEALQQYVGEAAAISAVRGPFLWTFALCYLGVLARAARALTDCHVEPYAHRAPGARRRELGRFLFGPAAETRSPWDILLRACLLALLLYLLLASFWFWPWYLIWPLALLALTDERRLIVPLILVGCAGELAYVGWNFVWHWWGVTWETTYQMDALVVFGMAAPTLLAYLFPSWKRRSAA